jgi:hypothetical protein
MWAKSEIKSGGPQGEDVGVSTPMGAELPPLKYLDANG